MSNVLLDVEILGPLIAAEYHLPAPVECTFLRRGFNDHYEVQAGDARYILRVYFQGKYYIQSENDFHFELDWLDFLHVRNVPVSHALSRRNGDTLGTLETPGGWRHYALFTYAQGEQKKTLDADLAFTLGQTLARVHATSDDFQSAHHRYHFNLRYLLDEPLQRIQTFLREQGQEGIDAYLPALQEMRASVEALPTTQPAYGLIHGDPHAGNYAVTEQGSVTFFDFDHGGYGWRAYDLATCKGRLSEEIWSACLNGYQQICPLMPEEIAMIPTFQKLRPIWDKGDVLAMRPAWENGEEFGEAFAQEIQTLFSRLFDVALG